MRGANYSDNFDKKKFGSLEEHILKRGDHLDQRGYAGRFCDYQIMVSNYIKLCGK